MWSSGWRWISLVAVLARRIRLCLIGCCVVISGMKLSRLVCQGLAIGVSGSTINNGGCAMDSLYTFDKGTVVTRLNRWGRWKMASGVALGFSSMAAFMRLGGGSNQSDRFGEIDYECIQTNIAVELLPLFHQDVIRVEYLLAYSESSVKANRCGVKKRTYYEYLEKAHDYVAKNLNLSLNSPHKDDINLLNVKKYA